MKVLITGATGFLGKYIVEELKNNGYQVVAFGRNEKIGKTLIDSNVEFFKGDIENKEEIETYLAVTSPKDKLVLTYTNKDNEGKQILRKYLC